MATRCSKPYSRLADLHLQEEFSPGAESALEQGLRDTKAELEAKGMERQRLEKEWNFLVQHADPPLLGALYFQFRTLADKMEQLDVQLAKLHGRLRAKEVNLMLFRGLRCLITLEQDGASL